MNYQDFCTKMTIFNFDENSSYSEKLHNVEFTKSFYADCFLHQELSNLIALTADKKTFSCDAEKDFETALQYLFFHYPLCNLEAKEENKKTRYDFDTEEAVSECKKWFINFYQDHSQLCQKLFPIVTFILGDSYEYLHEKSLSTTEDDFQEVLNSFIYKNLMGNYQQNYLYSLLHASITKKSSCILYGKNIKKSFKKRYNKAWCDTSTAWRPPAIIGKVNSHHNLVDYHLQLFFQLLEDCKIRNNLSSYNSERCKLYSVLAERKDYNTMLPLMGENFIALLLYLQDFTIGELKNNYWASYDTPLTVYALSQMTCWITPFTTEPIQYFMPLYNPYHPITCNYFNKNMILDVLEIEHPIWEYSDFSSEFNENEQKEPLSYIINFYNELQQWYHDSSEIEKRTFDDYITTSSYSLFKNFINCKCDKIYIPTDKDLRLNSKNTANLGYFYCLCYYFISHQLPKLIQDELLAEREQKFHMKQPHSL